jgi:glycerol uptake facilitator-like aquaporin
LVYYIYWSLFNEFDGNVRQIAGINGTADIFFTMPAKGVPVWNSFLDQVVGTAILMIFIMALGNVRYSIFAYI